MIKNRKKSLVLFFALVAITAIAQTKIIAHRGFSGVAPENTLSAFQKAIDIKADYLEIDVHKTIDDSLVIIHDETVDRTSSNEKNGVVETMSYAELMEVKVGYSIRFGDVYKDEKIPTLKEVLLLAKEKIKVCIELKTEGIELTVLKLVSELNMNDAVIIFSFKENALTTIRQMNQDIPLLQLIYQANEWSIMNAKKNKINILGVGGGTIINKEFLNVANKHGIEIWKWTVDDEAEMEQLKELGIDGIITNFPDKALSP